MFLQHNDLAGTAPDSNATDDIERANAGYDAAKRDGGKGFRSLFWRFRRVSSRYNLGRASAYGMRIYAFAWRSRDDPAIRASKEKFVPNAPSAPRCAKLEYPDVSFTLVTQASQDRLWMLRNHCTRWGTKDPISIAVFTRKSASEVLDELFPACDPRAVTVQTLSPMGVSHADYPINALRNLALSAVKTTHVDDVDFWPSQNLHRLLNWNEAKHQFAQDDKLAVVIPAFSVPRGTDTKMIPSMT